MTEKQPGLADAYALNGPDDNRRLYSRWAETYDRDFVAAEGYVLADRVAEALAGAGARGPVLDVGGGTGKVAARLAALGIGPVDGLDLSPEMLDVAVAQGLYRGVIVADVTQPLAENIAGYRAIVSAGTFTLGHVGPEPLPALIGRLAPGGHLVISVNLAHWRGRGFEAAVERLKPLCRDITTSDVRIYAEGAEGPHADDRARILVACKS